MWSTHDDDHEGRRRRHGRMGIEQQCVRERAICLVFLSGGEDVQVL